MIFTFYSYKGGVGRSMALANIAELFYNAGFKVLIVDWDLEAPGLERFFKIDYDKIIDNPGIIDMIKEYKKIMTEAPKSGDGVESIKFDDLDKFLIDIYPSSYRDGKLWLLTAGRRSREHFSEYASTVLNFNWFEFYQNWDGELYFEWLRKQLLKKAEIILIDSRTGVTEMGGVCTYQFADVVVMFCAPNRQNLHGINEMAKNLKMPHIKQLRRGRPLDLVIIPSRVEDRAEAKLLNDFHDIFVNTFSKYIPEKLSAGQEEFWKLKIPHVPFYAFNEEVVVREIGEIRSEDLVKAYASLAKAMTRITYSSLMESQSHDVLSEVKYLCAQGIFARDSNDFKEAEELFNKSLVLVKKVHDKTFYIRFCIEYAKLANLTGRINDVDRIFHQLSKLLKKENCRPEWVGLLLEIASLAEEIGRIDDAKKYYNLCFEIETASGNMLKAKEWYFSLAIKAIENNDFQKANLYFNLIRDIFKKSNSFSEIDELTQHLLDLERVIIKKKNHKLVLDWLVLYMDLIASRTASKGDSSQRIFEKGFDKLEKDLGKEELSTLLIMYIDYVKSKTEMEMKK